jgi:transposase
LGAENGHRVGRAGLAHLCDREQQERQIDDGEDEGDARGRRKSVRVDNRKIMNAIFYVLRTGMPWRDLPDRYGPYTTAYNRFNRWSRRGIWKRIFDTLASKSRDSLYLIDSTIVKAHRAASGAKGGRKARRSASAVAAGQRSSTRLSTAKAAR